MKLDKQLFTHVRLFLAQGPDYIATYGSWRMRRLARQFSEKLVKPRWPDEHVRGMLTDSIKEYLISSPAKSGLALQRYLLERPTPASHLSPAHLTQVVRSMPANRQAKTIELAEEIMQGKFSYRGIAVTFDQEVNWRYQPDANIDWTWDLNRHYCLVTLARAYLYSADERFVQHAVALLKSWMAQNPPRVNSPLWRPFEVSTRLNAWLWTFFLLLKSNYFARSGLIDMLVGIATQAQFLLENLEYHIKNNHLLLEAKTLAMVGLLLPEFKGALSWQQTGLRVVWQQFEAQVCQDGVHGERSTQYHLLVGSEMWELIQVLLGNQLPVPAIATPRFSKMVDFARAMVKPDQTIPLFGDAARTDEHIRFDIRWAAPGLPVTAELPGEETFWLLNYEPTSTVGQSGAESMGFPEGGYYIMRADSAGGSPYLAFDCGPFGYKPVPSHGHADALSFELFAFGETLITDSGSFRYHAPAAWRNYFRGTRAHNTLLIDGQDQSHLVGTRQVERPAVATAHSWFTSAALDLVEGSHDGYTRLAGQVTHRRKVLFVKPDYWLVLDEVQGVGDHQLDWFYHFMPGAKTTLNDISGELSCQVGQAGLVMRPLWPQGLRSSVITGDELTYQGWVALESGQKQAAPVLNYSYYGQIPFRLGLLLYPYQANKPPLLHLNLLETQPDFHGLKLKVNEQEDVLLITDSRQAALLTYGDWQAEASLFIIRQRAERKYELILANAMFASWQGQTIFAETQAVPLMSMSYVLAAQSQVNTLPGRGKVFT